MKKTVVIDTFSIGSFHEMFNASFLCVLLKNSEDSIDYIADSSAVESIKKLLIEDTDFEQWSKRVVFTEVRLPKGNTFYAIFFRYLYGAILNLIYIFKFKSYRVIFPSLNPLFAVFLKAVLNRRSIETFVVCHGELGYLFTKYPVKSPLFWYAMFLRPFFKKSLPADLRLIVLGSSIRRNLLKKYPYLEPSILSIHHPYIFKNLPVTRPNSQVCNFGWVGVATEAKGFHLFSELVEYFSGKYKENFSAYLIGWHPFVVDNYPHIKFVSSSHTFLDRQVFDKAVGELNFILFFYNNVQYKYTASGAIFDAIQHRRPVIALRNDYFEEVFETCGSIGFLCDSVDEMYSVIDRLINKKVEIEHFFTNLEKARFFFSAQYMKLTL